MIEHNSNSTLLIGKSSDQTEAQTQIKKMVSQINVMTNLLYEVKADTPLGKTLKVLLNLFLNKGKDGVLDLAGVSYQKLANLTGVTEKELQVSLDYLQQEGIIAYKPAVRKSN